MKNAAAILLLLVFLFNVAGYRLFFFYADQHADNSFTARVDKGQFQNAALITITVPLHMPYLADQRSERADGEITVNGQVYKYVSRAIRNDSLILNCLPDESRTAIAEARTHFGIELSGNQVPGKKIPESTRKFIPDNDYDLSGSPAPSSAFSGGRSALFARTRESVSSGPSLSLLQPPDRPAVS